LSAVLIAFRLYLPTLALRKVNEKLGLLEGYQGHIDRIGISLWRGAYQIGGLQIDKNGGKVPVPFFSAETIDFSLEWAALLHGRIVTDIEMQSPKINIVNGPTAESSATQPNESFAQTLKGLAPFDIDRLRVKNGEIHYQDFSSEPKVDIALTELQATARNLRNTEEAGVELPADIQVKGKAFETGVLTIGVKADPLKDQPTFELKQTLDGVALTKLNDLFEAYAKVRVKKGEFGLYAEASAKDGNFKGYAKPILRDVEIDTGRKSVGKKIWAAVASAVKWLISNKSKKQLATKIPLEGRIDDPKAGIWAAAIGILKNAYIKALTPTLDIDDKTKGKGR
jgi:uncharacterized protein involved in outer membrane biogenesis